MLCWCGVTSCAWRGVKPSCEMISCNGPDYDKGRVRVVDQWPKGFIGVMELEDIPEVTTKLTLGWSMVLILDRALGKNTTLSSWNANLVSTSYDRKTFTFSNTEHNSDLSNYLPTSSIRWAFVVDNLEDEMPMTAYLGLFNRQVNDAACVKAPRMLDIEPIMSNKVVEINTTPLTTTTTTEESDVTTQPTTTPSTTTPTTTAPPTTTSTTTTTTTTTTTPVTTTTKQTTTRKPKKKKKPRRRGKKNKKKITTTEPFAETTPNPTSLTTIFPTDSAVDSVLEDSKNDTTMEKSGGRYCVLQTHEDNFKTQDGWEDGGIPFFSGNCILNVTDHLLDWSMLVVFDSPIAEMQVWSVTTVDKSDDGRMWTFGPHEWNLDLYVGMSDINFIAKQATKTASIPTAKVYLCSLAFTEGDTIVISPNSPAQIALATGTLGMNNEEDETDTDDDVTIEETEEDKETPEEAASKATRWKKPDKIEKRCLPESPNGIIPAVQSQTVPDFKPNDDGTKYNYNEILHKSILFYEAQRAGKLPKNNRIPWRGDSTLKDGCDIGLDLSGGWFDAGDHVKFALPMASTVTLLSWGGLMFRDAYKDAGEFSNLLDCIKWPSQFLMRSHISKYEFVAQVGSGKIDHITYGRPEEMRMKRPTYILDPEHPGSEPTAETAAALAAAHILFKPTHRLFSKNAIKHAEELFEFADKFRAEYHNAIEDVKDFYFSYSGYNDELIWAAAWLYKATGKSKYLLKAKGLYIELGGQYAVESEFSWDRKLIAAQILLANLTGEELYRKPISGFLENVMNSKKTPKGLMWLRKWGANRYAANAAFMVMAASTLTPPLPKMEIYVEWARKQIHLVLGDIGRSYVVGFGRNYPERVHHRSSACTPFPAPCSRKTFYTPRPTYFTLYGGLVGGPDQKEIYSDNRVVYEQTEVACDYNAGFQGAVAGLKQIVIRKRAPKTTHAKHNLGRWSG
nr:endoglucanase 25-like isoform X2 [Styela clava]